MKVYFLTQVKHNKTNNTWDKGVVVKASEEEDNKDAILQTYHAYLGAYAYGHDENIDYVFAQITEAETGITILKETWPQVIL